MPTGAVAACPVVPSAGCTSAGEAAGPGDATSPLGALALWPRRASTSALIASIGLAARAAVSLARAAATARGSGCPAGASPLAARLGSTDPEGIAAVASGIEGPMLDVAGTGVGAAAESCIHPPSSATVCTTRGSWKLPAPSTYEGNTTLSTRRSRWTRSGRTAASLPWPSCRAAEVLVLERLGCRSNVGPAGNRVSGTIGRAFWIRLNAWSSITVDGAQVPPGALHEKLRA